MPSMPVRNRIRRFVESKEITPYAFAVNTGIAMNTAYHLFKDPMQIPNKSVLEKIHRAYPDVTPNDLIEFVLEEELKAS